MSIDLKEDEIYRLGDAESLGTSIDGDFEYCAFVRKAEVANCRVRYYAGCQRSVAGESCDADIQWEGDPYGCFTEAARAAEEMALDMRDADEIASSRSGGFGTSSVYE